MRGMKAGLLAGMLICQAGFFCQANAQGSPNPGANPTPQAGGNPDLVELITQCMKDAMTKFTAKQDGNTIEFACYGEKASLLFVRLGRFDKEELVSFKTGKYITRNFYDGTDKMMPDYCWQKVVGSDGAPATGFGCQLYYVAGRILGN